MITSILYIIADSFLYAYSKYLMEQKYYYFMDILIISGAIDLVLYIIIFIIISATQSVNNSNKLIFQFYQFYENYGTREMVSIFLVGMIPKGLIVCLSCKYWMCSELISCI